jgi:hypothetical protein
MSRENNFLIKINMMLRLKDDSISFIDWNKPSNFDEDDVEGEDLNAIFFYDVYKRGTNLEVILNEIHCKECALQVL